jgi:hypothetical protein
MSVIGNQLFFRMEVYGAPGCMSIHNSYIMLKVSFVWQIIHTESIPVTFGQEASDSKGFFDTHIASKEPRFKRGAL